jgi:V-type H+-transporting ATPase subunit a
MIFLQSIFGYLVICIIYKWTVDWSKVSTQPPSLLNMLINMFLSPGKVAPETQLYPGQAYVQVVLLLLAFICVPWLLITKPYFAWKEMKRIQGEGYMGLVDTARDDEVLEGEEEGNGRAIVEDAEDEHVRLHFIFYVAHVNHIDTVRSSTISARLLSIKSSTQSSFALGVFRTPRLICVCGPFRLHMPNCQKCSGR